MAAARRLPIIQQRGYLPPQYTDRKILEEKYPDPPNLSPAQDPDMVSVERRLWDPTSSGARQP
jgi:NADH dehydrogenase (ubiquinone) 1 beta subcomplex subunit 8